MKFSLLKENIILFLDINIDCMKTARYNEDALRLFCHRIAIIIIFVSRNVVTHRDHLLWKFLYRVRCGMARILQISGAAESSSQNFFQGSYLIFNKTSVVLNLPVLVLKIADFLAFTPLKSRFGNYFHLLPAANRVWYAVPI